MQELWRVEEQNRRDFGGSRYLLDFQQREKRRNHVGTKKKYERLWMTSVPTDTTPPLPRVRRVGDATEEGGATRTAGILPRRGEQLEAIGAQKTSVREGEGSRGHRGRGGWGGTGQGCNVP